MPWAMKLTVIQGYLASNAAFIVPVVLPFIPVSSSPVSCRLVVVATVNVTGDGVGVGTGVGVGVAEGVGEGVAVGVGVGVGAAVGVGEADPAMVGV